jgi:hypothetical protein
MDSPPKKKIPSPILGAVLGVIILAASAYYTSKGAGCSNAPKSSEPDTASGAPGTLVAAPAPAAPSPSSPARDVRLGNPSPIEPPTAAEPDMQTPSAPMSGEHHPE